jgi:hypothetical protein
MSGRPRSAGHDLKPGRDSGEQRQGRIAVNIAKLPELLNPVAHSEGGKHPGQGGDNRKCGD